MSRKTLLIALALVSSACDVFDPDTEVELGNLFFDTNPAIVSIPDSVFAEVPFQVIVRTRGDSCDSFGYTEVETDGLFVEIRPFDRRQTDEICTAVQNIIDHSVILRFGRRGTATVRVIGMRVPGGTEAEIEEQVLVVRKPL